MLPSFLYSSYKQYKTDSNAVANWLATTASKHDFSQDQSTPPKPCQPLPKPPKLKGRARKLARNAAKQQPGIGNHESSKFDAPQQQLKHLIAIKDFVPLAEWIASRDPVVVVPDNFVRALQRAITVRKRHQQWWHRQALFINQLYQDDGNTQESHGYFISILEKVQDVLKPIMSVQAHKVSHTPGKDEVEVDVARSARITNLFEGLHVEEPSDESTTVEEKAMSDKKAEEVPVEYAMDQDDDMEEVYFAVHCLFNDLDNLRRYLRNVWDGYKQGTFDLISASITTNTAIGFAHLLQEEFCATFPKYTDFERHVKVLYIQVCLAAGLSPLSKERPDDEMNFEVYEAAVPTLFPTYMLLSSFSDVIQPAKLPSYKPGFFGTYDPTSDRAKKSARDKFREDKVLLLEILPDFCVLTLRHGSTPAEDEMARGISEMMKQKKVSLWLTFAAQLFLDIHHILREEVNRGHGDLVRSVQYIESGLQQVLKFHENLHIETWPKSNDQVLFRLLEDIKNWVKTDVIAESRRRLLKKSDPVLDFVGPSRFFQHHPMYCGLLAFRFKMIAHEAGVTFANAWGAVVYTAHLYNALCQERILTKTWDDMNLALLMHESQKIFVGDFPKNMEDYFKRFCLAMGYSATNSAKRKRQNRATASKAGPRGLDNISPVSDMFKERFCYDNGRADLSPDDVDTILKMHADQEEDEQVDDPDSAEWQTPRIKINVSTLSDDADEEDEVRPSRRRKAQPSSLSGARPLEILNGLLEELQSESLGLTFNHFRLHTFSWRLLRALKDELDQDLKLLYGADYLEKENQLPWIVGYILMTAVEIRELPKVLSPKRKPVVTTRLLMRAAEVMKTMLDAGAGQIETNMLKGWYEMEIEMPDILGTPDT